MQKSSFEKMGSKDKTHWHLNCARNSRWLKDHARVSSNLTIIFRSGIQNYRYSTIKFWPHVFNLYSIE